MKHWPVRVAVLDALVLVGAGCDWTAFGYSPAHTRYNSGEKTIGVGNVATLTTGSTGCSGTPKTCAPLWSAFTTAGGVESSPAVANGVVYVEANGLYAFAP